LRQLIRKLKRALAYAVHGWNSEDWDSHHLLEDIRFKIRRLRLDLEGSIVDLDEDNGKIAHKSIKLAERILNKLITDDYMHNYRKILDEYGDLDFVRLENALGYSLKFKKETDENTKEIREKTKAAHLKDDAQRARDERNFFKLLEKYYKYWWT